MGSTLEQVEDQESAMIFHPGEIGRRLVQTKNPSRSLGFLNSKIASQNEAEAYWISRNNSPSRYTQTARVAEVANVEAISITPRKFCTEGSQMLCCKM